MSVDLDRFIATGAAALGASLDGRPVAGIPVDLELRFWDPQVEARHRQRFSEGRLVAWTRDSVPASRGPDLVCPARQLGALLGMVGEGPTLESFRLRHGDTGVIEPPPPFDTTTTAALAATPEIPDADCVVGLHFADSPLAASDVTVTIIDGRPTFTIGTPLDPDVDASLRFDLTLRYMAGELGLMDMLTEGSITGDWPQLMLLAGTIESPEFQAAIGAARGDFRYLADAVRVLSAPAYRTAMIDARFGESIR